MLWVLGSLCQLYRIPFDARLVLQRFAPPYTLATLGEGAQSLGLTVGEWKKAAAFAAVSMPCVALLRVRSPGQAANEDTSQYETVPALIVKSDGTRFLFFRAGSESGETAAVTEFEAMVGRPFARRAEEPTTAKTGPWRDRSRVRALVIVAPADD